jgi:hypothetical protein
MLWLEFVSSTVCGVRSVLTHVERILSNGVYLRFAHINYQYRPLHFNRSNSNIKSKEQAQ